MDLVPGLYSPKPVASGCVGWALGPFTHILVINVTIALRDNLQSKYVLSDQK